MSALGQKRTWRPVLVIGLLFWFALRLIRNAERSFHAACYTAYGAANDGSNCPANRACRSASFRAPWLAPCCAPPTTPCALAMTGTARAPRIPTRINVAFICILQLKNKEAYRASWG